jgi:putative ABC transport system ATP-binding protein
MTELPQDSDLAMACHRVTKTYHRGSSAVAALTNVDLNAPKGRITALFGPSGSGKSTLLRLLAAVDRPDEGDIFLGSQSIGSLSSGRRRRLRRSAIAYVFQEPSHNLVSYLTVNEQLVLAARLRGVSLTEIGGLLAAVGLEGRADHLPRQLSGGEQQRLAFAAAVTGHPEVVLSDEPTAELDKASGARLLAAVVALSERGTTCVIASHDPAVREVAHVVGGRDHGRVSR